MEMEKEERKMAFDSCRRLGLERRTYGYDAYFPERRVEKERRSGLDRRKVDAGRNDGLDRRLIGN